MPEGLPDLLQQLRDIHEPIAPGWWPLAYGWWIVLAIIAFLLACVAWYSFRKYSEFAPYRTLRRLSRKAVASHSVQTLTDIQFQDHVNQLFKRLMIHVEGQHNLRNIYGQDWLEILKDRFNEPRFMTGAGENLGEMRYQPNPALHPEFIELVKQTLGKVKPPVKQADD